MTKPCVRGRRLAAPLAALAATAPAALMAQPMPTQLAPVVVTGNPLGQATPMAPADAVLGTELLLRRQGSLGATLDGLPGVSATGFGPNASRPVIRGQDGDRIRVLSNGAALGDASALSFDHAVPVDPLVVDRIEVLRGPAALLYGGSAIGGVVNLIDGRIDRERLFDARGGISGRVSLSAATGDAARRAGLLLDGGTDRYTLHVDASTGTQRDTRVPLALACTQGGVTETAPRLCNSAGRNDGLGLGATLHLDRGYIGLSYARDARGYGTVAEDEVTIGMAQRQFTLEGEWRAPGAAVERWRWQFSRHLYTHTEFDAGVAGTVFGQNGRELRVQAEHRALAGWKGVVGVQLDRSSFAADGAEAFAPHSLTRANALFVHEERETGWGRLSVGARSESVQVSSLGNALVPRFALGDRRFNPLSVAFGALVNGLTGWQFTGNLARVQRAPKDYELYADGPHIATGAYEIGDPTAGVERSVHADVGVRWQQGPIRASVNLWTSRFANYLSLEGTDFANDAGNAGGVRASASVTDCGDGTSVASGCVDDVLTELAYRQVRARFSGLEAAGQWRLAEGAALAGGTLDLAWRADLVRATNLGTGQPLPRIAPARIGATLVWTRGAWGARLGADRWAAQNRVPAAQAPVAGYTLWHAALTHRVRLAGSEVTAFARLNNATDRLASSASSILTQTVPGKVPLAGRSLTVGLQAAF